MLDSADVRWDGPGVVMPDVVDAKAKPLLRVAPHSVVVLSSEVK